MVEALLCKDRSLWQDFVTDMIVKYPKGNFRRFDTSSLDFNKDAFIQSLTMISLFEEEHYIFLRFADESDQEKYLTEEMLAYFSLTHDIRLYVALAKKPLIKSKAHQFFKNYGSLEAKNLSDLSVREMLVKHKIKMSDDAYRLLLKKLKADKLRLESFIQLADLLDRELVYQDIDLLLSDSIEEDIFALSNALLSHNLKEAFRIYHDYAYQKLDVLAMIGIIAASFRTNFQIAYLHDLAYENSRIASELGIKEGRVYMVLKNHYQNPKRSLAILNRLAHFEQGIKSGLYDKNLAFELFLTSLI